MSKIFISYRRQDSRPVATLIYEPLARHFEARFGAGAFSWTCTAFRSA